jgi:DNA-directed RNA polymerase specialized sigma24 family protein
MAPTRPGTGTTQVSADAALSGILALLVDEREERAKENKSTVKTEVLLDNVGMSAEAIAAVTGKNVAAVRKTIQRARAK